MTRRLHRGVRQRGQCDARKAKQLVKGAFHREEAFDIADALVVMLALGAQLADLDEDSPEPGGQMLAQMAGEAGAVDIAGGVNGGEFAEDGVARLRWVPGENWRTDSRRSSKNSSR